MASNVRRVHVAAGSSASINSSGIPTGLGSAAMSLTTPTPVTLASTSTTATNNINGFNKVPAAALYDDATTTLIKNILVPTESLQQPLDRTLPALTSFPSIDIELYAFIALILRQFIQSWYARVSDEDGVPDKTFVFEVVHVIAHVTRSLEERLRKVDLAMLLLDDIPFVLDAHLRDYRIAKQKVDTAYAAGLSFETMFHSMQPHPALNGPDEDAEKKFLSILSKGIMSILLPSEDLDSATERTLLRSLLADVVLWKVIDKLSEPFMVHGIISKAIEKSLNLPEPSTSSEPNDILVDEKQNSSVQQQESFASTAFDSARWFVITFMSFLSYLQSGVVFLVSLIRTTYDTHIAQPTTSQNDKPPDRHRQPSLLTIALFPTIARLLNLSARQPWLMSTIELLALPLVSLPSGSIIDRLLSNVFDKYIMTAKFACSVLAISRQTLFPNNGTMAPSRDYPSPEEKREILRRVHRNILRVVPASMRKQFLGDDAMQGVEELLSPFENKFANKHLLYFLFDIVIVKVLPELSQMTPEELKSWRLGE
ncbi:PXA domain-containing protein [Limtongia smithiae]|uniref:PXA domain-containing protein n=1 Tax=Limtongia smithiae TaxID=1125753 RepID=UPI0034CF3DA5